MKYLVDGKIYEKIEDAKAAEQEFVKQEKANAARNAEKMQLAEKVRDDLINAYLRYLYHNFE